MSVFVYVYGSLNNHTVFSYVPLSYYTDVLKKTSDLKGNNEILYK